MNIAKACTCPLIALACMTLGATQAHSATTITLTDDSVFEVDAIRTLGKFTVSMTERRMGWYAECRTHPRNTLSIMLVLPPETAGSAPTIEVPGRSATYRPAPPQQPHEGPLAYEPQWTELTMARTLVSDLFRTGTRVHAGTEFVVENRATPATNERLRKRLLDQCAGSR